MRLHTKFKYINIKTDCTLKLHDEKHYTISMLHKHISDIRLYRFRCPCVVWRSHRRYTVYTIRQSTRKPSHYETPKITTVLHTKSEVSVKKLVSCLKTESDRNHWRKKGGSKECRLRSNKQQTRLNIGCWSDMQENEEWPTWLKILLYVRPIMSNVEAFFRDPEMWDVWL